MNENSGSVTGGVEGKIVLLCYLAWSFISFLGVMSICFPFTAVIGSSHFISMGRMEMWFLLRVILVVVHALQ